MARTVQRILARVFSVVLLLVAVGALFGGNYAHHYVSDQLRQEKITMPAAENLYNDEMKQALSQYAGQQMTTGPQAEAFANHYIWEHMMKSSGGRTYEEVSGEFTKMSDAEKATPQGQKAAALRQSLFMGDALRSTLLTAYAFWMIGTIATVVGWIALALSLLLAALGWFVWKDRAARPAQTTASVDDRTTGATLA